MEVDKHELNVPGWVDLATDLDKGKAFYSGLFGWEIPEGSEKTAFYSNAALKGKSVAGIYLQEKGMPSFWTTYIIVENVDDVAKKVKDAGGQVVMAPMDVMDYGRMAVLADPAGAVFGVWQPGTHKGAEIVTEPGAYTWSELITTDVEGAKAFYRDVFGWSGDTQTSGPIEYTQWMIGDRPVGGMMQKPDVMPAEVPPHWGVYFAVASIDDGLAKLKELGGSVMMDPIDTPAGKVAPVTDSHGANFSIIELSGDVG